MQLEKELSASRLLAMNISLLTELETRDFSS
jgi:hypothetical protein